MHEDKEHTPPQNELVPTNVAESAGVNRITGELFAQLFKAI